MNLKKKILIFGSIITIILSILWYLKIISEPLVAIGLGVVTLFGYIITPENESNKTTIKQKHSGSGDNIAGNKVVNNK